MGFSSKFVGVYGENDSVSPFLVCDPQLLLPAAERIPDKAKAALDTTDGSFAWSDLYSAHALAFRSYTKLTRDAVQKLINLRFAVRSGVGTDNVDPGIILDGVQYANCCPKSPEGVSRRLWLYYEMDHARIRESDAAFENGKPGDPFPKDARVKPLDPQNRQVVLFGHGAIGSEVVRRFEREYPGIRIAVYDPDPAVRVPSSNVRFATHEEALQAADVLIFCVPGQAGCLLGKEHVSLIKPNARVFNASRGNTVDVEALGILADEKNVKFALDVFPDEKDGFFNRDDCNKLRNHPNKIALTSHTAGSDEWVETGNAVAAVQRIQSFGKRGEQNIDDRRELPFPELRPAEFRSTMGGGRILLAHDSKTPEEVRETIRKINEKLGIQSQHIRTVSSAGRHGMPLAGFSVIDVYDDASPDSPDFARASAVERMLSAHIGGTRSTIAAYVRIFEEDPEMEHYGGLS